MPPKSGNTKQKQLARAQRRAEGRTRRLPSVLDDVHSRSGTLSMKGAAGPSEKPSTELVRVCNKQHGGYTIFGSEVPLYWCARPAGHEAIDQLGDVPPGEVYCGIGGFDFAVHIFHGEQMAMIDHETAMNTDPAEREAWLEAENEAYFEQQRLFADVPEDADCFMMPAL
ncbi:hypothetical protein Slala04_12350 [Streptomyces lavendulae subsp. lavendulae]|nr:hypothetical protein Slala04_12350 [Streptomyces lavendulae subsp. lavendulae]